MADIISLGCRLNIAESETIRAMLGNRDTVVVNSCAVTNEAVRRTRQAIRRARRDRPDSEIVVTGCAAQIDADSFATMPEVNRVIGNADKLLPAAWASEEAVVVSDIMRVAETAPHLAASFSEHARAFVEVQNGCDHRCTFCAIPYGRGNSRSVPAGSVIERIAGLVDVGHREVVLTGVDLTSWGADLPGQPQQPDRHRFARRGPVEQPADGGALAPLVARPHRFSLGLDHRRQAVEKLPRARP